jgi:hypothetical protein
MTKKQDLKKYLDKELPKDILEIPDKYQEGYIYYHSMKSIDESLYTTGNKEIMICVDLPGIYTWEMGQFHADYALVLKNGKLTKRDKVPQGKVHRSNTYRNDEHASVDKKSVFYTSLGGSKKAFTVKKGEDVYLKEYKYVNGVLYLKGEKEIEDKASGKTGWIKSSNFYGYTGNHM